MDPIETLYELLKARVGQKVTWMRRENYGGDVKADLSGVELTSAHEIVITLDDVRIHHVHLLYDWWSIEDRPLRYFITRGFYPADLQRDGSLVVLTGNQHLTIQPTTYEG